MQFTEIKQKTRLGRLLIERGLVTAEQLEQAISQQRENRTCCLGGILVEHGAITKAQLEDCLREQARVRVFKQTRLGNLLVERGLVDREQLTAAIREQKTRQGRNIGQILVEQGIINESQLRACLRHQCQLRLSAAVLALSITPFQAAFADRGPNISYSPSEAVAASMADPDRAGGETFADSAAVEKMVGLAARAAWDDLTGDRELTLATNAADDGSQPLTAYRVGLSGSGLNFKSVSQDGFSTSSYRLKLSPSGDVEVNYTIRF